METKILLHSIINLLTHISSFHAAMPLDVIYIIFHNKSLEKMIIAWVGTNANTSTLDKNYSAHLVKKLGMLSNSLFHRCCTSGIGTNWFMKEHANAVTLFTALSTLLNSYFSGSIVCLLSLFYTTSEFPRYRVFSNWMYFTQLLKTLTKTTIIFVKPPGQGASRAY